MMPTDGPPEPALLGAWRSALVIGTSTYLSGQYADLPGVAQDAHDMRETLADPHICGFGDVRMLIDEPVEKIRRAVNELFDDNRSPEDLVLVYLSCHGVRDLRGRLHFAATDTDPGIRASTTLSARELKEMADDCPARRKVIILDSCYSGAFGAKTVGAPDLKTDFGNDSDSRGLVVLSASRSAEYAFARQRSDGGFAGSVFTAALLEGLRTGRAGLSNNGWITVQDAYRYAHSVVRQSGRRQTPQMQLYEAEGQDIVLARNPAGVRAGEPDLYQLVRDLERPHHRVRKAAVETFGDLLHDDNPAIALAARENLMVILTTDRSPELVNLAKSLLTHVGTANLGPGIYEVSAPSPPRRPPSPRPTATGRPAPGFPEVPAARHRPDTAPEPEPPRPAVATPSAGGTPDRVRWAGADIMDGPSDLSPDVAPAEYLDDWDANRPPDPMNETSGDGVDHPSWQDDFEGLRPGADPLGVFAPRRIAPLEPEPSRAVAYRLFPTEKFRGEWRRHWIAPVNAAAVAGLASGVVWHPMMPHLPHLPAQLAGTSIAVVLRAVALVVAIAAGWRALAWHASRIALTHKRVLLLRGILLRRTTTAPLEHITDIRSTQTPLGRLLGYGTLILNTGRVRSNRIRLIPQFAEIYLRTVEELYEPAAVEARLGLTDVDEDSAF